MPISTKPSAFAVATDAYRTSDGRMGINTLTGQSGAITISPTSQYTVLSGITGSTTVTFSAPTRLPGTSANTGNVWYVEVRSRGSNSIAFNNISWDGGAAPTFASGTSKTVVGFYSPDFGTTIYGWSELANL